MDTRIAQMTVGTSERSSLERIERFLRDIKQPVFKKEFMDANLSEHQSFNLTSI
jgi:hypothetical protein